MWGKFWLRWLARILLGVVAYFLIAYPLDFAVWHYRAARGGGMSQVEVYDVVAAEEKGRVEEYLQTQSTVVPCSETLYPQGGYSPCWYLRGHRDRIIRY